MLRSEIAFRKLTNPLEVHQHADLFKMNKIPDEKLEQNFSSLLSTEYYQPLEMPDEDEILEKIKEIFNA